MVNTGCGPERALTASCSLLASLPTDVDDWITTQRRYLYGNPQMQDIALIDPSMSKFIWSARHCSVGWRDFATGSADQGASDDAVGRSLGAFAGFASSSNGIPNEESVMSTSQSRGQAPRIASREEWLAARIALLVKEKELTAMKDRLAAERHLEHNAAHGGGAQ